ncbi:MAG: T9SS C-terminal target domain-containing protein [Haliscomenobacteraceae bacterium CHB4]|nr:T9SS C-terminal target domain-containing protein [Haliscomenobacteraceae bacterium CHB4]
MYNTHLMHNFLLFIFVLLSCETGKAQTTHYVNQNVSGGLQNGTDWTDAFPNLQQALTTASYGDAIWVAAGTYKPTDGANRNISFNLVSGVQVYGGFSGLETTLEQRDPQINETILSGDIGAPGVNTDNSYHVVRGKGLDENTVLDGFIVTGGYSFGQFTPNALDGLGAGILLEGTPGLDNSRPIIANCRFERNYAYLGGALCTTWEDPDLPAQGKNPVNPILLQCEFNRNRANLYGGAMYVNSPSGPMDTFTLERCIIADNYAYAGEGGGIYFNQTANSSTRMTSCVFERDTGQLGGGIYYPGDLQPMNISSLVLDSCIFRNNVSPEGGGLFHTGPLSPAAVGVQFFCRMRHCTFDGNKATSGSGSAYLMHATHAGKVTAEVTNCTFINNLSGDFTTVIGASFGSETDIHLEHCLFFNNHDRNSPEKICLAIHSGSSGGNATNKVVTQINNCLFINNGGGVAVQSGQKNYVKTNITNCTFYNNNEYIFIKSWDTLYNQPNGYYNDFFIDNCIVWETETDMVKMFYNNDPDNFTMYDFHVNNTLLNLSDSTGIPGSLEAFEDGLIFNQYPEFLDTALADFRLEPCSPAVNKGSNQPTLTAGLLTDLDGNTRIRYGTVDMGAYEQQDSCDMVAVPELSNIAILRLWPNPSAGGDLYFQTPNEKDNTGMVRVFDASGLEVYRQYLSVISDNYLNLGHLPPGMYQVRLETPQNVMIGKWIKLQF